MADEFIAKVKAEIDTSGLESQISKIKPQGKIPLKVQVDASDIEKQIKNAVESASKSIQLTFDTNTSSKNSGSGSSSGGSDSNTNEVYKSQATTIAYQIDSRKLDKQISSLVSGSYRIIDQSQLNEINTAISKLYELRDAMKESFTAGNFESVVNMFREYEQEFTRASNELTTYKNLMTEVNNVSREMSSGVYTRNAYNMENQLSPFGDFTSGALNNARNYVAEYQSIIKKLSNAYDTETKTFDEGILSNEAVVNDRARLKELEGLFKSSMSEIKAEASGVNLNKMLTDIDTRGYEKTFAGLTNQIEQLGKAGKDVDFSDTYNSLTTSFNNLQTAIAGNDLNEIIKAYKNFQVEVNNTQVALNNFSSSTGWTATLKSSISSVADTFTKVFGANFIYREIRQIGQEMVSTVNEIDTAMNQLQIVTGASENQMTEFFETSISLAKELGQSVTDVLDSVQVYSRLGYDLEESSELAEYTSILSNVAAVDVEEATTGLTSTIKGFDLNVSDAEHVSDVLITVGQNYAVSAGEILEAFEKSSAAMAASDTSFEQAAAIIAAGIRKSCLWNAVMQSIRTRLIARTSQSLATTIIWETDYECAKAEITARMNIWGNPTYFYNG